jgi:hypothetical protein
MRIEVYLTSGGRWSWRRVEADGSVSLRQASLGNFLADDAIADALEKNPDASDADVSRVTP